MTDRERVEALIGRNDFNTAEALMRKSGLPPEEQQALEAMIRERKRLQAREWKKKRRRGRFARRLRKFNLHAWKGFLAVFVVLGVIVSPYGRFAYLSTLASYDGPPFQHDLLFDFLTLLAFLDMVLFWGLVILEAVLDREKWSRERFGGVFLAWLAAFLLMLLFFVLRWVL